MDIISFIVNNKWIILFYVLIILIVAFKRKRFEFQAKFIALYKTKIGIKAIEKFGDKHREFLRILGYIGIGVGFSGMLFILYVVLDGLYKLIFVSSDIATFGLIIPGVKIPGSPVFLPFWYGIIALFFVVLIHEFGHGIIARVYKIPIQSTGIVFFGPLIGAFVEPDEKALQKHDDIVQYSIFAAGPFMNVILAIFVILLLSVVVNPLQMSMVDETGFSFAEITEDMPASIAGVTPETTYDMVNGEPTENTDELLEKLSCIAPGDPVTVGNENVSLTIIAGEHPDDTSKGFLGVMGIKGEYQLKNPTPVNKAIFFILQWLQGLFEWIFLLSIGIGAANLLPLGPVDGGRMIRTAFIKVYGEKKGVKIWGKLSVILLVVILVLIITPIISSFL